MPTPGGLLKAGDRLVHVDHPDTIYVVKERHGQDRGYSVIIGREDGQPIKIGEGWSHDRIRKDGTVMMLEAHYHVFMSRTSGWSLVKEPPKHTMANPLKKPGDPDGYVVIHRRATDALYFGPFFTLDHVARFLEANPTVNKVVVPLYRNVDWNRKG